MKITGLWVPLVTPMYQGRFDAQSAKKLLESIDEFVDGYVVALSTGEGDALPEDLWREAMSEFISLSDKPVMAGILGKELYEVARLSQIAKELGCAAIVVPVVDPSEKEILNFFTALDEKTGLPIIVYNTEHASVRSTDAVRQLDALKNIVGLKDSSADDSFIAELSEVKAQLRITILQGLENKLLQSKGYDGYLIALANVEPQLCKTMLTNPTEETNAKILQKFWEYNLGGEWYVTLKALLYSRGILRSAEQVRQAIKI